MPTFEYNQRPHERSRTNGEKIIFIFNIITEEYKEIFRVTHFTNWDWTIRLQSWETHTWIWAS